METTAAVAEATKRGRQPPPLGGEESCRQPIVSVAAAAPPSLKRARHDTSSAENKSEDNNPMEAPLAVALSQSMDSVNTATGEEEVSVSIRSVSRTVGHVAFLPDSFLFGFWVLDLYLEIPRNSLVFVRAGSLCNM